MIYWFAKTRTLQWESLHFSPLLFFSFLLMFVSGVLSTAALALQFGKESGAWKEISERSTFCEMTTGRVPILKDETIPPPRRSSGAGLIMALAISLPPILVIPIYILANSPTAALCLIAVMILSILFFGFFIKRNEK